jgi:hypothetical protein
MSAPSVSDADFIRLYEEIGPRAMSRRLSLDLRGISRRRELIERKYRRSIRSANGPANNLPHTYVEHPQRAALSVSDGIVLVGSDAHYWPGEPSTAHRGFVRFCREYEPAAVILNGDVIDACAISRHPPINWESRPTVQQEIETAQDRLHEIEMAMPRGCRRVWTLGNHDSRFETRLATVAPEFAKVAGVHLKDHFPNWQPAWSAWVNDDVVIKHRFKGGVHATHNNTVASGKTMVTGHLHSAKVTPYTDYNGDRYGVDTGCLADPESAAFMGYTEDSPKNWRSAFGVLTFVDGRLLFPELAVVLEPGRIQFRGKIINVSDTQAPRRAKDSHAKTARAQKSRDGRRTRVHRRDRTARGRARTG